MYFGKFPLFSARVNGTQILIEDFFARIAPGKKYTDLVNAMSPYFVDEGKTIEQIAFEVYGRVDLHWVIVLCNNIVDPYREWPVNADVLTKQVFDRYPFILNVVANHGLVVGDVVENAGNLFDVVDASTETLKLKSRQGLCYISREDVLVKRGTTTPIVIRSVIDPTEDIHHYVDVETGLIVDYNVVDVASGASIPVTNWDHEQNENTKKRTIRILQKQYLNDFIQMFDREIST